MVDTIDFIAYWHERLHHRRYDVNTIIKLAAAAIFSLALTACGGGGGDDDNNNQGTYTVTPSVSSGGGAIGPATPVSVQSGATASFTLQPSSGYTIAPVGGTCGGTLSGATYTTKAITASCTVVATFAVNSSAPLTFSYEALPSLAASLGSNPTDFLAQLNQEGAKGYFYQDNQSGGKNWTGADRTTFVNDGSGQTYTYDLLDFTTCTEKIMNFVDQANAEGAKGYLFETAYEFQTDPNDFSCYALYRKDSGSSATYTYVAEPETVTTADFLTQANGWGQAGYSIYPSSLYFYGVNNLYIKNNASQATYTYDLQTQPAPVNDFLGQLNSEGAKGYLAMYLDTVPGMVYVKDQTQTATFTYQSLPANPTIDQENSYGAQGYVYWGWLQFQQPNGPAAAYYAKASNCSGWMCTAFNPAVFSAAIPTDAFVAPEEVITSGPLPAAAPSN
jgi:hypothetical protein